MGINTANRRATARAVRPLSKSFVGDQALVLLGEADRVEHVAAALADMRVVGVTTELAHVPAARALSPFAGATVQEKPSPETTSTAAQTKTSARSTSANAVAGIGGKG